MALQANFDLGGGVTILSAYHRVSYLNVDVDGQCGEVVVKIYKDKATRDANGQPFASKSFQITNDSFPNYLTASDVDPLNINHISQAYEYLKTLPDYQGALDV